MRRAQLVAVEFVVFDPEDPDTYPSVCADPEEVKERFGFERGDVLIFSVQGAYIGQVVKRLGIFGPEEVVR